MDLAQRCAQMSYAKRAQVGCIVERGGQILAQGWNGTPAGEDNCCEYVIDGQLVTKESVRHAEFNALQKMYDLGITARGSTVYVTLAPCIHCAKLIQFMGVYRVVYLFDYKDMLGVRWLNSQHIPTEKIYADN